MSLQRLWSVSWPPSGLWSVLFSYSTNGVINRLANWTHQLAFFLEPWPIDRKPVLSTDFVSLTRLFCDALLWCFGLPIGGPHDSLAPILVLSCVVTLSLVLASSRLDLAVGSFHSFLSNSCGHASLGYQDQVLMNSNNPFWGIIRAKIATTRN